jgi:metal-responsive CopG/Arc/MetJ family transcriptional regulator
VKKQVILKRITTSVDQIDYQKLEAIAAEKSCSVSYLIRQAMKNYIRKYDNRKNKEDVT